MRRKVIAIIGTLAFIVAIMSVAFAADGNARKGKFLYRKNCRTCHNAEGKAPDLSPNSKTQAEWKAVFADPAAIPCHDKWEGVADGDVTDIFTYLHDYAKDSPTPAKCS